MNNSCKMLKKFDKPFVLMVSIPRNEPEMAAAASVNGADGIKVHLNVNHFASGTGFGSWNEEKKKIQRILEIVDIPVGLLPGSERIAQKEEIMEARDMGIDFLDSFAHHMPLYMWEIERLGHMLAVNREYTREMVQGLDHNGMNMLEATIMPQIEYGTPLNMRDISLYYQLSQWSKCPLIIPTQKKIRPEEVRMLKKAGARGIVIGAVVTGRTVEGVAKVTGEFSEAIRKMAADEH